METPLDTLQKVIVGFINVYPYLFIEVNQMPTEEYLKIPRERVGVLIGKNGEVKAQIERLTQTDLEIDSENRCSYTHTP